jgi:hypothetical protein
VASSTERQPNQRQASLIYSTNTNISVCKPSGVIERALEEYLKEVLVKDYGSETLAQLRAKYPLGTIPQDFTWESWNASWVEIPEEVC